MYKLLLLVFSGLLVGCSETTGDEPRDFSSDSTVLVQMISTREQAMVARDLSAVMQPFDTAATFVNGGGYWYTGKKEIRSFHEAMFTNDSLTYTYKAGAVHIESIRPRVAVLYFPWQQQWMMKAGATDTLNETGLMTIVAVKKGGSWHWRSITNQRTKEYFEDLVQHKAPVMK